MLIYYLFLAKQEMNALLGMKMLDLVCFAIEQILVYARIFFSS